MWGRLLRRRAAAARQKDPKPDVGQVVNLRAVVNRATLRNDLDENEELYGKRLANKEILTGAVKPPASASELIAALNRHSRVEDGQRSRTDP